METLQYSCLENPMDGGAWWAAVYGIAQSWTWLEWLCSSSTSRLFGGSHSDQHETVPHCCFDLPFSHNEWCWTFFHVFVSHLYVFFGKMSVYFFGLLFDRVAWAACIFFEINYLSVVLFAIIFSHSEGCLFTFLIVSFAVQKLLRLIRSHLFTFVFISIALESGSERIFRNLCQRVFYLFSSKSFIVSGLTFRSLIRFEFISVYGVSKRSTSSLYIATLLI